MKSLQLFLFLTPLACLLAQSPAPTAQAPKPPAVPVMPPGAGSVSPDTVVLSVGDEKITAAQFDRLLDGLPPQYRNQMRTTGRRQFAENVVMLKILAQEAHAHKLDDTPAYKEQLESQVERLMAQLYYQELVKETKADEASAREYYEQHKSDYLQAKVLQILVRAKGSPIMLKKDAKELADDEALAKATDIRKKLADGADFATVAKAESDDPSASNNGGDLGTIGHGRLPPPVEQIAFTIPVGELSAPIKSPQGYHIIKVESRQEKTFVEVRPEIERRLDQELIRKKMEDLKTAKNVVFNPEYFGPAAPPTMAKPGITIQPKPVK
ncbi:MAG TPA: peptidylprolyl isomerase [Bryobacteraceae bacterium]|nr:peptidylprolyl isomerase [Bryobacteraceae bacterium]